MPNGYLVRQVKFKSKIDASCMQKQLPSQNLRVSNLITPYIQLQKHSKNNLQKALLIPGNALKTSFETDEATGHVNCQIW